MNNNNTDRLDSIKSISLVGSVRSEQEAHGVCFFLNSARLHCDPQNGEDEASAPGPTRPSPSNGAAEGPASSAALCKQQQQQQLLIIMLVIMITSQRGRRPAIAIPQPGGAQHGAVAGGAVERRLARLLAADNRNSTRTECWLLAPWSQVVHSTASHFRS